MTERTRVAGIRMPSLAGPYRARGNAVVDGKGTQLVVVLATNCSKTFATALAEAAAKEANHLATQQERLNRGKAAAPSVAKAAGGRKTPARHACEERDMGGTECPGGQCCRPGMCGRHIKESAVGCE